MTIPTIAELQAQIEADIKGKLGITNTWVGKSILRVISYVQAAKLKLIYMQLAYVYKNIFADTADSEDNGGKLESFGRAKLGRNRLEATNGKYTCTVTGIDGSVIKKGQTFVSNTGSQNPDKVFESIADYTLSGTTGTITVQALEGGLSSLLSIDEVITATSPIAGIISDITVAAIVVTPTDKETIEEYRALTLLNFRLEPQGGAAADYRLWTSAVEGIRTVYPYKTNNQTDQVDIFVESLDETVKYEPTQSILDAVISDIELDPDTTKQLWERGRRPITVVVNCLKIKVFEIKVIVNINSYNNNDISTVNNLIKESIISDVYNIRPYVVGADTNINNTLNVGIITNSVYKSLSGFGVSIGTITLTDEANAIIDFDKIFGNDINSYGEIPYISQANITINA